LHDDPNVEPTKFGSLQYEGLIHVFQGFTFLPEAREVWETVGKALTV
jgi:hypothetical protein